MGVEPKIGGKLTPQNGFCENKGSKPYERMDDLEVPLFLEFPPKYPKMDGLFHGKPYKNG